MNRMKQISNLPSLISYIRLMLGEPLIKVELTDQHIEQVITDTLKTYTDVVYGFFEKTELIKVEQYNQKFRFLDWDEVTKVQSVIEPKKQISFTWDSIKRTLSVQGDFTGELLVIGQSRYVVDEEFDLIFDESWVKEYATAKTQLVWGKTLGKYSQNLVGGATVNYDRLISEAENDITRLMEELYEKWVDPAPVLVG